MLELATAMMMGFAVSVDGDTLDIYDIRIRLWGIDAPEMNTDEGKAAKFYLQKIINDHGGIVECHETGKPSYGRMVARCSILDKDIGALMICAGHAKEWKTYTKSPEYPDGYYSKLACEVDYE